MSKAVLVMDMPESCYQCPFGNDDFECDVIGSHVYIGFMSGKPKWCPLRPMPEKKKTICYENDSWCTVGEKTKNIGWNACIDAIGGND